MARAKTPRDAVQFTRESAERIGRVVRAAELTPPAAEPLSFEPWFGDRRIKHVRAATFTGSWAINASKAVTFKHAPTATVNATNLSWPITQNYAAPENCIVGKEGTNWWLVVPVLQTASAIFVTQTVARTVVTSVSTITSQLNYLADVSISGSLNTSDCTITIGVTRTTGSVTVLTGITPRTTSVIVIAQHNTSQFLRVRVP